jgi:hypothetical protein
MPHVLTRAQCSSIDAQSDSLVSRPPSLLESPSSRRAMRVVGQTDADQPKV